MNSINLTIWFLRSYGHLDCLFRQTIIALAEFLAQSFVRAVKSFIPIMVFVIDILPVLKTGAPKSLPVALQYQTRLHSAFLTEF